MENRQHQEVLALSTAMRWLACIEEDEVTDPIDISLRRAVRGYIAELKYRAGILTPYISDLDRLHKLKDWLHSLDPVYDHMAELAGDAVMLPAEVQALLNFLSVLIMDLSQVIRAIEDQYPQWSTVFASERQMYSDWQAGKGPLAGSPWQFEDEAEADSE